MPYIKPAFYTIFVTIVPLIGGLVLFYRIKKNSILHARQFFWSYAMGFALLTLVNAPSLFINLRLFQINYDFLLFLYAIAFFGVLLAYLFFYRGTVSLFIDNKFFSNILPLAILPVFAIITLALLFLSKIETSILYTIGIWGFLVPLDAVLGSLFLYFFIGGAPFDSNKRLISNLILGIAWLFILLLEVYLWYDVVIFAEQKFWILRIASHQNWFLARGFGNMLLLFGSLMFSKRMQNTT